MTKKDGKKPPVSVLVEMASAGGADLKIASEEHAASITKRNLEEYVEKTKQYVTGAHVNAVHQLVAACDQRMQEAVWLYFAGKPLPGAAKFHASQAKERLLTGSNRSGKTLAAAVELTRAVTGGDPRYPARDGTAVVVAQDMRSLGSVIWKKLGQSSGLLKYLHPETNEWRLACPTNEEDLKYRRFWRDAGPLIPSRLIKPEHITWYSVKAGLPKKVHFPHNGWTILFFSANAVPLKGMAVDVVWFDEEITNEMWYPEMSARLVDRNGWFFWSVTPEVGTQQFADLYAQSCRPDSKRVASFHMHINDNRFLTQEAKDEFYAKLAPLGADKVRAKWDGIPVSIGTKVFPEFRKDGPHVIDQFPIPYEWTIYVGIDPGRQVSAAVIAAIPDPRCETHDRSAVYIIGEAVVEEADPNSFAVELAKKLEGRPVEEFVIDMSSARQTTVGNTRTVGDLYMDAFRKINLRARLPAFATGMMDVNGRAEVIRSYLIGDGTSDRVVPKVFFVRERTPRLLWELERYRYVTDRQSGTVRTRGGRPTIVGKEDHCVDALGYLLAHNLRWVASKALPDTTKRARERWHRDQARSRQRSLFSSDGVA